MNTFKKAIDKIEDSLMHVYGTVWNLLDHSIVFLPVIFIVSMLLVGISFVKEPKEETVFNKAVFHDSEMVIELESWKDYSDDQYQLVATDGTVYLVSKDSTILVCDQKVETLSQ